MSGTKTSQSEMDGNIVIADGKVKTPKLYLYIWMQIDHQKIQRMYLVIFETSRISTIIIKKS